jgi:hypothetical protein
MTVCVYLYPSIQTEAETAVKLCESLFLELTLTLEIHASIETQS